MSEIPEEIRKMFPDQPIHKMDIVDGELQILASSEPLSKFPDLLTMSRNEFDDLLVELSSVHNSWNTRYRLLTVYDQLCSRADSWKDLATRLMKYLAHDSDCKEAGFGDECSCGMDRLADEFYRRSAEETSK